MMHPEPDGSRSSILFALAIAGLGVALSVFVVYDGRESRLAAAWPSVPCEIVASGVEEGPGDEYPYGLRVVFRYEWNGKRFVSDRVCTGKWGITSDDIAEIERRVREFPPGAKRTCFVDPTDPTRAVLEREAVWEFYAGAGFFLGMAGLLLTMYLVPYFTGRPLDETPRSAAWLGGFIAVMAGVGFVMFFGLPMARLAASRGWTPTRCVVESGHVRKRIMGGEFHVIVFRPDVIFRYRAGGREYRANTYNPTDYPTPWYYGKRRIVRRYPPGLATTCYVNPADPSEATLTRHASPTLWFGLGPLVLVAIGVAGLIGGWTGREVRFGSARLWGSLALWAGTGFAVLLLWTLGNDLIEDARLGQAGLIEGVVVAIVALTAGALASALGRQARRRRQARMWPSP